jgi:hypothetical protein
MGLAEVQTLGALLAKSGYFQDARDAAQAAVKVMAGAELGLPPIASMMGIAIIKGKVALSSNLMAALIRQHGYDFKVVKLDNQGCVLTFIAKDKSTVLGESSFFEADARAAGIAGENYKKYPRNMYFARAVSNGAKWFTPEIFGGAATYTPEELGAAVDSEGNIDPPLSDAAPHATVAPAPVPARRVEEAKPAPAPLPDIEPRLAELYAQANGFAETVAVVTSFKGIINELVGSEADYYRIIGGHGMAHGNELQGRKRGEIKSIIKELYDFCVAAASPPPPDPTEADSARDALAEGTDAR